MKKNPITQLHLEIAYATKPGETIYVTGNHDFLGGGNVKEAVPLVYQDSQHWAVSLAIPLSKQTLLTYAYFVVNDDGSRTFEGGLPKHLLVLPGEQVYSKDTWLTAGWLQNTFTTAPFKEVFFRPDFRKTPNKKSHDDTTTLTLRAALPGLPKDNILGVLGNHEHLGNWNTEAAIPMEKDGKGAWEVHLSLPRDLFPIAYKYVLLKKNSKTVIAFEEGDNRWVHLPNSHRRVVAQDGYARLPIPNWRGAGVAIPVFSLRSARSKGVGSFLDLIPFTSWAQSVGLKVVQLLPVNDTISTHSWTDSYPYAAISAFALHPMYADIQDIAAYLEVSLPKSISKGLVFDSMDNAPVDYELVNTNKQKALRWLYENCPQEFLEPSKFKEFAKGNEKWLFAYAFFCYFRDAYGTAVFGSWPNHQKYDEGALKKLAKKDPIIKKAIGYYYFVQFHLDRQLQTAHEYATARRIIFKGDLPIGIYRHSADAWQDPELYHMDRQAGAPPDDFAVKGQNWGFPTYNWERMAADDFLWWQRRFAQMQRYYDAFRIDHILGFFRIWSIPMHAVEGIMGFFEPAFPVSIHEFSERYIQFDYQRFVTPYLTDDFLVLRFSKDASLIAQTFMVRQASGLYELKPAFDTQQKVAEFCDNKTAYATFKEGLFDCISNVLLFEVPNSGGQAFHFRFNMHHTYSFQQLPPHLQSSLTALYNDYFFKRQDAMWEKEAMQKLPRLKFATDMLVCGEDLGLVPSCVPDVMEQLEILSLEIQRMPKDPNTSLLNVKNVPYRSVATPATHDTSTIRGWWEESREQVQQFFNEHLGLTGEAPESCSGSLNEAVVSAHLSTPSMWSIFQWQDLLGMDETLRHPDPEAERINIPANPKHHWRYRMHLSIDTLEKAKGFNKKLKQLLETNKR